MSLLEAFDFGINLKSIRFGSTAQNVLMISVRMVARKYSINVQKHAGYVRRTMLPRSPLQPNRPRPIRRQNRPLLFLLDPQLRFRQVRLRKSFAQNYYKYSILSLQAISVCQTKEKIFKIYHFNQNALFSKIFLFLFAGDLTNRVVRLEHFMKEMTHESSINSQKLDDLNGMVMTVGKFITS